MGEIEALRGELLIFTATACKPADELTCLYPGYGVWIGCCLAVPPLPVFLLQGRVTSCSHKCTCVSGDQGRNKHQAIITSFRHRCCRYDAVIGMTSGLADVYSTNKVRAWRGSVLVRTVASLSQLF